jgi:NDP-sugar pyrophosphorylase family protein
MIMKNPTLVVLAAGMGSRYGGLKQIDAVDSAGHIIIDYSIYDAIKAGFRDFVFIIKKEIEEEFRSIMDPHINGKGINVSYVFQELDEIPSGFTLPECRKKPWGTGHAIACCENTVDAPFAVINADDYYGENAFYEMYKFLSTPHSDNKYHFCMVGYRLANTVTDNGAVSRGVCTVENGYLTEVVETTGIRTCEGRIYYENDGKQVDLHPQTIVSMNLWGFSADFISECKSRFSEFLEKNIDSNPEKCEFYIPTVVSALLNENKADVKVLETSDQWYGVTYREDKDLVVEAFGKLIADGKYPAEF